MAIRQVNLDQGMSGGNMFDTLDPGQQMGIRKQLASQPPNMPLNNQMGAPSFNTPSFGGTKRPMLGMPNPMGNGMPMGNAGMQNQNPMQFGNPNPMMGQQQQQMGAPGMSILQQILQSRMQRPFGQ